MTQMNRTKNPSVHRAIMTEGMQQTSGNTEHNDENKHQEKEDTQGKAQEQDDEDGLYNK